MKRSISSILSTVLVLLLLLPGCIQAEAVQDGPRLTPAWARDAVIYEVNVRQYTGEGTFAAFAERLPALFDASATVLLCGQGAETLNMEEYRIGEADLKGTVTLQPWEFWIISR